MNTNKQVELTAAAPKTEPPRLKITLKLTEIPNAAIAIPKRHMLLALRSLKSAQTLVKMYQ